ncbi:hypothetical protein B296_00022974 [Ensete ventricosum]|uniref:Uncharacterized protein n=1 Tax=Ensete ventricosum TaxID=4639 RepID=A0A426YUE2_ENSVE|nr:hypothetical protein B296_00022974 [Ensete ventricosum]
MTGAMELQPDDGIISSLSIEPGSDGAMGSRREFARRFAEGIGKLVGNTSGDRRKKTRRLVARMSEAVELAGLKCKGLVFTQRRSVVDVDVPREGGLRSGRRPLVPNNYKNCEWFFAFNDYVILVLKLPIYLNS